MKIARNIILITKTFYAPELIKSVIHFKELNLVDVYALSIDISCWDGKTSSEL